MMPDMERHLPFLAETDLTQVQKENIIQTLWEFFEGLVEQCGGYQGGANLQSPADSIDSKGGSLRRCFERKKGQAHG